MVDTPASKAEEPAPKIDRRTGLPNENDERAMLSAQRAAQTVFEVHTLTEVVERAILAAEALSGKDDAQKMDLSKTIETGDPKHPEVTMRNLLRSSLVHRAIDRKAKVKEAGEALDVKSTYNLLLRWLARMELAINFEKGKKPLDSVDVSTQVQIRGEITRFQLQQKTKPQKDDIDLAQMISTWDSARPQIRLSSLVEATMSMRAKYNRDQGRILDLDAEEVQKCAEKSRDFIYWLEEAKEITE